MLIAKLRMDIENYSAARDTGIVVTAKFSISSLHDTWYKLPLNIIMKAYQLQVAGL